MLRISILLVILCLGAFGTFEAFASPEASAKMQVIEDVNEYSQNDCINCQVSRGPAITSAAPDLRSASDLDQKVEKIAEPFLMHVEIESEHSLAPRSKSKGRGPAVLP